MCAGVCAPKSFGTVLPKLGLEFVRDGKSATPVDVTARGVDVASLLSHPQV